MPDDHTSSPEPVPSEGRTAGHRIRVLLPLPLPEALDYLVTGGSAPPEPGTFVRVPLGQRNLAGVVWDGAGDELPVERLKPVLEMLPGPALRPELRRFVERVAAYTMASPGSVLRMAMSVPEALQTAAAATALCGFARRCCGTRRDAERKASHHRHGGGCWSCCATGRR